MPQIQSHIFRCSSFPFIVPWPGCDACFEGGGSPEPVCGLDHDLFRLLVGLGERHLVAGRRRVAEARGRAHRLRAGRHVPEEVGSEALLVFHLQVFGTVR